jgi:cyclic beta-1,2-glucan synthetase
MQHLNKLRSTIARNLERSYGKLPRQAGAETPAAEAALIRERRFVKCQLGELKKSLSRKFCRSLARAGRTSLRDEPRIYRVVADKLGCLLETALGSQGIASMLTAGALAELLAPERIEEQLTLAELWAIPTMAKLILLDRIHRNLSDPDRRQEIPGALDCLRAVTRVRWAAVIESVSTVHRALSEDPSGIYLKMEFRSRDLYRRVIEDLAQESGESEEAIARLAVTLARESAERDRDSRASHVGWYLIDQGVACLRERGELRESWRTRIGDLVHRAPSVPYLGGIAVLTAVLTFVLYRITAPDSMWWMALFWLPLSQVAVWVVNFVVTHLLKPRVLPRLDFSKGIPSEHRTVIAVPTLLLSRPMVERLLERVEIHYLANRDANLVFALLTDFPDSKQPRAADDPLLGYCLRGIRRLNARYASDGRAPFYLFHRMQRWNERQHVWMGFERKRGKLEDFNRFLLGVEDNFAVKAGDLAALGPIEFVVTVDSDTLLPRDTVQKLVGTMVHPLHRPVIDPATRTIREGYAILQPALSTSMESAVRSRLARILSGQAGLDSYATAISDVYQDLHGRANFTGKGIYDVRAVHAVLDRRFPPDAILSHDLIEGEYARVGLITDVNMVEDFPATYEGFCQRRHRWVRGDWQLLYWLLPWVPAAEGGWTRNPLGTISRWKIADNLRRSLFELGLLLMIVLGWTLAPEASVRISLAAVGILVFSTFSDVVSGILHLPALRFWPRHFRECQRELRRASAATLFTIAFLPDQALLMADAIGRTLVRRFFTKRNLLEWVSMAQTESRSGDPIRGTPARILLIALLALAIVRYFLAGPPWFAFSFAALWASAPLIGRFLNAPGRRFVPERSGETEFLRDISLRTWRYFIDFSRPSNHWLVPDNVQEEPQSIAHRASPTNIGLQLASNVAACDFGYITRPELAARLESLLYTIEQMERYRGHLWNWYDTETLDACAPRYVSTVDSGNLAAALITVKQACEEMEERPVMDASLLDGIRDHCFRLRQVLPMYARHLPVIHSLEGLTWRIEGHPMNLFAWRDVLKEASELAAKLNGRVGAMEGELGSEKMEEIRYWRTALSRRVAKAREMLLDIAPWLDEVFRDELSRRAENPRFEDLLEALSHVPHLGQLPATYETIDDCLAQILGPSHALARESAELLARLRRRIRAARIRARSFLDQFSRNADAASKLVEEMDFAFLFDADRELMHIGYNAESRKLDGSYYDLLASEARTAVFLAVAKGDAPSRIWFQLGRKSTWFEGHLTLVSWSGTMFEYLMPSIFMRTYEPTLLGRSLAGAVQVQQAFARTLDIPWGISESSCSRRNQDSEYAYRAFGIPAVSLSPDEDASLVVAPYASLLALMIDRQPAMENLQWMASQGWTGRYGFFDAVDYEAVSPARKTASVVRSFMAHHQGMGLLALSNALFNNTMQNRFHAEPMIAATEILLQERVSTMFVMADS